MARKPNKGSFPKGKSGNPEGRPKVDQDWKAWCQQFAKDNRLHIATKALEDTRLLVFICEQAHGKAAQAVVHSGQMKIEPVLDAIAEGLKGIPGASEKILPLLRPLADDESVH